MQQKHEAKAVDSDGQPPDAASRKRVLAGACTAHVAHDGLADGLYTLLPVWAAALGLSYASAGLLRAAYSIAMAALQLPAGLLAERVGERRLLALGTIAAGAAFALTAAASQYAAFFALILAAGVASAVQHPIASSLVSRAYDAAERRAALGIYNFSGDVGKMAVSAALGVTIALAGWQWATCGFGILMMVIGVGLLVLLPGRDRPAREAPKAPVASDAAPAVEGGDTRFGIVDVRGYTLLAAIQIIDSAARVGVLTLVPFLLVGKGATVATAGFGLSLLFAGGALGKLACGFLAERLGIIRTVLLTELLTAVIVAVLLLLPLHVALVTLPILGIALNGTSSVLYGTVADFVDPARQARAFGLFYTLGSAAGASAPVLFGGLADLAGLSVGLAAVAVAVLTSLPVALALSPHLDRVSARA